MPGQRVAQILAVLVVCALGAGCGSAPPSAPTPPVPVVAAILIDASILAGQSTTGTAVLNSTALADGTTVSLSVDDPALSVPASVSIAAGSRTATFEVTSRQVTKTTTAVITATANGFSRTAPIMVRVDPAALRPPTTNYTITFSGLPTGLPGPPQPVTLYEEDRYRVRPVAAAWEAGGSALIFRVRGQAFEMVTMVGEAEITALDNTPFWLRSLTLYSSTTSVPYVIEGFLSTTRMYSVSGSVRDFGRFVPVTAAAFDRPVDLVRIRLTNILEGRSFIATNNPMGFDDVALSR